MTSEEHSISDELLAQAVTLVVTGRRDDSQVIEVARGRALKLKRSNKIERTADTRFGGS